ncbi:MAG: acetate--CoA ligase family protein [Deltaproteobacteria bacterium]|nr:acetate--CoA ligase family protein [Deltaproteobacteria bacterium]MBW2304373.1 acetate--CoA ligase family protein [Deltaproteobacteria bacterium]
MLKKEIIEVVHASMDKGWILEPEAKNILRSYGIGVPRLKWTSSPEEAVQFAREHGFPVVAKVVSQRVVHKSDVGGVITGIKDEESLNDAFRRFSRMEGFAGVLVEETVSGMELMAGAKVDYQFGPVILFGMGGTGVEIYKDTVLRMAPLRESDILSMVRKLKAHELLEGYRGSEPINMEALTSTLLAFSDLVMDIREYMDSIDLNPIFCSPESCIVADARIILSKERGEGSAKTGSCRK